jgi:hypothetical protein
MPSETEKFNWRERELQKMDEALGMYADTKDWLNADGQTKARSGVVDELLDARNKLAREIAEGRP